MRHAGRDAGGAAKISRRALGVAFALLGAPAWSAPSEPAKAEIEHLFAYLGASGCMFNRNGSWYPAGDAVDHLRQKYDYLVRKDLVSSAEQFIARGASESSMSGKPYLVRCAGAQPVESGAWLRAELRRFRAARRSE